MSSRQSRAPPVETAVMRLVATLYLMNSAMFDMGIFSCVSLQWTTVGGACNAPLRNFAKANKDGEEPSAVSAAEPTRSARGNRAPAERLNRITVLVQRLREGDEGHE